MLSPYVFVSVHHQEAVPAKSTILCVTMYFLASGMGIFVGDFVVSGGLLCSSSLLCLGPLCKMCTERVYVLL